MRTLLRASVLLAASSFALAAVEAAAPPVIPAASSDSSAHDVQDVLYVGKPHPLLLRLHLSSAGQSVLARWDAFMGKLFDYLDRNKSGGLDRVEARFAPPPQQMQQFFVGNAFLPSNPRLVVPFEQLDADRDGKVTLDELKAYYAKNGAGAVQVQTTVAPSGFVDPLTDVLFNLLDTNKDGKLSREELLAAERVLMRYDANDDELISQQELGETNINSAFALVQAAQLRGRVAQPQSVLLLVPRDDGRRVTGKLTLTREVLNRYDKDKDGKLTLDEIGFSREMFDRLDRNKDGKIDVLELLRWMKEKPTAEFSVRLGNDRQANLRGLAPPAQRPVDAMSVSLPGLRIRVVPQTIQLRYAPEAYFQMIFDQVDAGRKGMISRKQVESQENIYLRGLFDRADTNGDGRLTRQELTSYLTLITSARGLQISLSLVSSGKGLFQALDTNGDGQISVREMRNAWDQLAGYDLDGDGCISRWEFPQQLRLLVSDAPTAVNRQPIIADLNNLIRTTVPVRVARGPFWFRKMDRNGDGDVSRKEWLGTEEQFRAIDLDGDGLISVEEAEAFEARTRPKDS
jgi:Ca2+-binding EF-hand superfamily protein